MNANSKIILLTKEQALHERLSNLLAEEEADFPPVSVTNDLQELRKSLEGSMIPFVLIDYDSHRNGILEDIEVISGDFPMTRFIMITDEFSSELVMKSMQSGIRHVQTKQGMEAELGDILQRLLPRMDSGGGNQGSAFVLLSAGGGCGSTTLAVNLANELQLASEEMVLLVDMDYHYGAIGTYLGLTGQYGISDLLTHSGQIDSNLIDTTVVKYSDSLHALISPASIHFQETRPITSDHLTPVLEACKQGYTYTLIDAPRVTMDIAASLSESCDGAFIVFQASVKDVRIAKSIITSLSNRGVPTDKIYPVLNRYKKRGEMVTIDEAQNALGGLKVISMANDYRSAVKGINFGKPLSKSAPRSALRKDLRGVVQRITAKQRLT